ncbi:acyl-CoA dehydrogenase family protein [Streptomyces violaceorubidus]|uniref:Acyl-CoA dehydrogenase family protein n=1 Tax=Streptomyces violaceorubidus TaxID=284042 RepID=A0ABV1SUV7_9ACTN
MPLSGNHPRIRPDGRTRALVDAARAASPVLARHAADADAESRLAPEAVRALREAGMFRLGTPRRFGGEAAPVGMSLDVSSEIALACPASGWVVMVTYVAQQIAASFGDQALKDLWAEGPDVPMSGVFGSVGVSAVPADGGIRVTGRWGWASGCRHAEWAIVGVPLLGDDGTVSGRGLALVPTADLVVEDTWDMVGMRGTGSDTLVADDVFVPAHRLKDFADVLDGDRHAEEPLHRVAPGSMTMASMGPLLGIGRAVLALTMESVEGGKPMAMSLYPRLADAPSVQAQLADAATLIDSAHLHLARSAALVDEAADAGTALDPVDRARVRMDVGHASVCLRDAVQLLLSVNGAGGFSRAKAIQRYWRDLETAARHPTLNPGLAREMYGRALAGDPRPVSPMV